MRNSTDYKYCDPGGRVPCGFCIAGTSSLNPAKGMVIRVVFVVRV